MAVAERPRWPWPMADGPQAGFGPGVPEDVLEDVLACWACWAGWACSMGVLITPNGRAGACWA
jgi:hypothetical protein